MKTKEWNPEKVSDQLTLRAIERRRPLTATFELTYRCNFRCKMCYVRMSDAQAAPYGRMRTVEEWLDMARQLRDAGVLHLKLTGGECTQYPGFERLYEELAQMGFRLHILSNAGAYTDAIRELFTEYPPYSASITLYGGSNETYAAVTGDPKGFDRTLENIRFFQSIGVRVGIGFTIIRDNVLDYPKVEQICRELNLPLSYATAIHPHLRNPEFSQALEVRLSPAQRVCVERKHPWNVEKALKDAEELEKELEHFELPTISDEPPPPKIDACVGSYIAGAFLWNGEMTTCLSLTGSKKYYPFEVGFEAAWQEMKRDHAQTFLMPPKCQNCALQEKCNFRCQGMCNSFTKDAHTPDEEICKYTWLAERYQFHFDDGEPNMISGASPCT